MTPVNSSLPWGGIRATLCRGLPLEQSGNSSLSPCLLRSLSPIISVRLTHSFKLKFDPKTTMDAVVCPPLFQGVRKRHPPPSFSVLGELQSSDLRDGNVRGPNDVMWKTALQRQPKEQHSQVYS